MCVKRNLFMFYPFFPSHNLFLFQSFLYDETASLFTAYSWHLISLFFHCQPSLRHKLLPPRLFQSDSTDLYALLLTPLYSFFIWWQKNTLKIKITSWHFATWYCPVTFHLIQDKFQTFYQDLEGPKQSGLSSPLWPCGLLCFFLQPKFLYENYP